MMSTEFMFVRHQACRFDTAWQLHKHTAQDGHRSKNLHCSLWCLCHGHCSWCDVEGMWHCPHCHCLDAFRTNTEVEWRWLAANLIWLML